MTGRKRRMLFIAGCVFSVVMVVLVILPAFGTPCGNARVAESAIMLRRTLESHVASAKVNAPEAGHSDWHFQEGYWISSEHRALISDDTDVILAVRRVRSENGKPLPVLGYADMHVQGGSGAVPHIGDAFARNRAARERLGLAPFPPEFESWLLTGEPASVGEGTFVPPRLEMSPASVGSDVESLP